jgi:hypothetical protein
MASKKPIPKKQEPPAEQAAANPTAATEPERTTSTVQVRIETKGRMEILKGMLNLQDFDAVITRLIDNLPEKLSTEEEKHLVMTSSKYRWLMEQQHSCDCRNFLQEAVR